MKLFAKKKLLLIAAIFAIVGFIGAFLSPLKATMDLGITTLEESLGMGDVYFGTEVSKGTILPFLAFFLLLAGAVVLFLARKKDSKKLAIIGIALLVVGALVPLFTEALYISANMADIPAEMAEQVKTAAKEMYSLGFGPILAAIGGFGGAAIAAIATFVAKD